MKRDQVIKMTEKKQTPTLNLYSGKKQKVEKAKPSPAESKKGFAWGNNELDKNAMGGTEMMKYGLYERLNDDVKDYYQIITSRVRELDGRPAILWLHDMWNDPEAQHLKEESSRDRFKKLVFVSNWQQYSYQLTMGIPPSKCLVLKNAIEPIPEHKKPEDKINLIYHTTPHRGLHLLWPVYCELYKHFGDNIHLDVYSSFEAYGWKERDEEYSQLFDELRDHPGITYHGYQKNEVVREALQKAHIFAYPCIWPETSCISVIEAMSASCCVVCPNLAALPETTGNWATMYPYHEDQEKHANIFINQLATAIDRYRQPGMEDKWFNQKGWTDTWYNWDLRAAQWNGWLKDLKQYC